MKPYFGACLAFAGVCLMSSAAVGVADWVICIGNHGGSACRSSRGDATTALMGAANVALGVALQDRREGP
jgi:hypothetical protein